MFGNAHLNAPSGALRFGSTLDRRGLLRAGVVLSGAGTDEALIGFTGFLEFRPLSPRRFTPLLGVGGGLLQSIYDAESSSTNGIGLLSAGVAVRISRGHTITLRGQYGDSYKQSKFHSIHLGWELWL